jgi:hypothetical protein
MCSFSLIAAFLPADTRALVPGFIIDFSMVISFMVFPLPLLSALLSICAAG